MHIEETSIKANDTTSLFGVLLNNSKATAAPADTINACPEGKANSESAPIKQSDFGIIALGLATASFAITPMGMRTIMDIAITMAVFLPVQPPNTNKSIIAMGQNTSLP